MRSFLQAALAACALIALSAPGHAWPQYAAKEKKDCAYCHTSPAGGPRNARGQYYEKHNHSFAGYSETPATQPGTTVKKSGPPAYKSAWRAALPADTRRVALADVKGDKKPRLIVLGANAITIYKPTATLSDVEATIPVAADTPGIYVGKFASGKPAVIAVPGAIYYWDGSKFAQKAAPELTNIIGTVRFADGTEQIITATGGKPEAWGVSLTGDKPLTVGRDLVPPDQAAGVYSETVIHGSPEMLTAMGLPEEAVKAGVVGGFDPRADKKFYGWSIWQTPENAVLAVVDASKMTPGANIADVQPVWKSPEIPGKVLDVALGADPKNPQQTGILVLTTAGANGADRAVQFFALD